MNKKKTLARVLSVLISSVLVAGCQSGYTGAPPQDAPLPPPDFSQVILTPEYTACEPAETKIAQLGTIFYDAAFALTNGNLATYQAKLAEAEEFEVPQYKEAVVYKNSVVTGIQLIKMVVEDPGNTGLQADYERHLVLIDEKAAQWRAKACGTSAQTSQGQPNQNDGSAQGQSGQDTNQQSGSGNDSTGQESAGPSGQDCETLRRAVQELTKLSVDAVSDLPSYDIYLTQAAGVNVGSSAEGLTFKDAFISYMEELKASIEDPGDMSLRQEAQTQLTAMQSAQAQWEIKACGSSAIRP